MDYLTGHIRSAWLLAGCSSACFSPVLLPSVPVWQLAHLIYLIGLVQSVGNVLKANQGDGGTSAGDIVSRVWKEVEQLQDGPPRLTCPGSTSGLCWDIQQRETDEISDGDSSPQLHRWARRDHQLSTHALWRVNTQSAPTQPTLLSQVQSAPACVLRRDRQTHWTFCRTITSQAGPGSTGQHRQHPDDPWCDTREQIRPSARILSVSILMIQFVFLLTVQLTLLEKPTREIILILLSIEDELSKYAALLSGGTSSSSSSSQ